MNLSPFLSLNRPCDETLQWVKERLTRAELRPVQTFDLHAARTGLHDCPCPNHGTDECDCQMLVVLVYGKKQGVSTTLDTGVSTTLDKKKSPRLDANPVTLILHGNSGWTWLSIADGPAQKANTKTAARLRHILEANAPLLDPKTI